MSKPEEAQMKVDALTLKTEEEISALIAKKFQN